MKKTTFLFIGFCTLFLLTSCGQPKKETTAIKSSDSSSKSVNQLRTENVTSSSHSSTNQTTTSSTSEPQHIGEAPIGIWKQENQKLTIDSKGKWKLEGKLSLSGNLTLAAGNTKQWLLKLYGFDLRNGGIGTYFLATFNSTHSKMNFGYLGTFSKEAFLEGPFDSSLYLPKFRTDLIDYTHELLGTWSMENKAYDFQVQTNYNPDFTFEKFSSGKGIPDTGTYTVTPLADHVIRIDQSVNQSVKSVTYKLLDSRLIPSESNWATEIRNTVPNHPN